MTVGALLNFWPSDMPFHILYYCLGIVAYRRQWFAVPGGIGSVCVWLLACVVLSPLLCTLGNIEATNAELGATLGFQATMRLCKAALCMGFLGLLISVAERYTNQPSAFRRHMAANSYRTYLLHVTVVILVQFMLLQWTSLPGIVVLLTGIVLSLLGSHLSAVLVGKVLTGAIRLWVSPNPPSR